MGPALAAVQIIGGPIPIVVNCLAVLLLAALVMRPLPRGRRRRWIVLALVAGAVGAGVGLLLCWLLGDILNLWDVGLSPATRTWVGASFGAIAIAIVSLFTSSARRRVAAIAGILVFAVAGTVGVNADFGQYPTLASVVELSTFSDGPSDALANERAFAGSAPAQQLELWKTWTAPTGMPDKGEVTAVTIPATISHFPARQALVYLPPAALVPRPPALPVLIMLSGQPGAPDNVFISGHLDSVLDAFAAHNHGLAPIVVVPDQLSASQVNPMCVDSAIGNSASYLTVDVPAWITANLSVQKPPASWGIGGFSQGGTCSIQLGAAHPTLFGSIIDVSGELEPKVGSPEQTIEKGFAGDAAAYAAATPLAILARNSPYENTVAVFGVGALDGKYSAWRSTVSAAAAAAGMKTTLITSPGTAHDWNTATYVFTHALTQVGVQLGLLRPAQ